MTSTAMHRLPNTLGWLVPALDTLRADVLICGRRLLALEPLQHASEEGVPVLLIHARDDNKTPFAGARALAHALGPRVQFLQLDSGGHADLATTRREEFSKALQGFEKTAALTAGRSPADDTRQDSSRQPKSGHKKRPHVDASTWGLLCKGSGTDLLFALLHYHRLWLLDDRGRNGNG
jgi:hypothetical protein